MKTGKTLTVQMPDESKLGPKFRALRSDMKKAFVIAYVYGGGNPRNAARAAGYSDSTEHILGVAVSKLTHDSDVLDAIHEMSFRYMHSLVPQALAAITETINMPSHKERVKVALSILDRTGLQGISEHRVVVEKEPSRAELIASTRQLCSDMGMDPELVLAGVLSRKRLPPAHPGPEVIDAEVVEVVKPAKVIPSPSGQKVQAGAKLRKRLLVPPGSSAVLGDGLKADRYTFPVKPVRYHKRWKPPGEPKPARPEITEAEHSAIGLEDIL